MLIFGKDSGAEHHEHTYLQQSLWGIKPKYTSKAELRETISSMEDLLNQIKAASGGECTDKDDQATMYSCSTSCSNGFRLTSLCLIY